MDKVQDILAVLSEATAKGEHALKNSDKVDKVSNAMADTIVKHPEILDILEYATATASENVATRK